MKTGICTYCGNFRELTKDHIPPKTIFPKPRPSNLVTVPCCLICNDAAKKDDEYFGVMMAIRDDAQNHLSSEKVLPKILDGLQHEKAHGFKRKVFNNFAIKDVVTSTGIYIGRYPVFEEEAAPIIRVMERIAKGLFYLEKRKPYSQNYEIHVKFGRSLIESNIESQRVLSHAVSTLSAVAPKTIGNGEFKYWLRFTEDDENTFGTIIQIYKSRYFLCFSIPVNYKATL